MSDEKLGSFNLDELAKQQGLDLHIISKNEHPKDADLRRFKEKGLFILTMVLISLTFIGAIFFIIFRPESQNENIVLNGLVSIVMLILGYFRGKSSL